MSPEPVVALQLEKGKTRQLEAQSPPPRPQGYYSVYSSQQGPELDDYFEGHEEGVDLNHYLDEWEQGQPVYNEDWDQDNQVGYGGIWDQDEREGDEHNFARDSPPKQGRRADNDVSAFFRLYAGVRKTEPLSELISSQDDDERNKRPQITYSYQRRRRRIWSTQQQTSQSETTGINACSRYA